MPQMKKMSAEELQKISATMNSERIKLTPQERFEIVRKKSVSKERIRKFHFQGIVCGDEIYLFNGIGEEIKVFPNTLEGKRECRIFALYEIFLLTPEEKRFGGYKITFDK